MKLAQTVSPMKLLLLVQNVMMMMRILVTKTLIKHQKSKHSLRSAQSQPE
jgi:hypothetical protein